MRPALRPRSHVTFSRHPGYITSIQTRGGEHHHQAWLTTGETTAVVVKLTACLDAFVLFTPYFGQAHVANYEIGLGWDQNSRVIVKKDYVEVRTPGAPELVPFPRQRPS